MNPNEMTIKLQEALQAASGLAMRRNHQGIDVEHLLVALLEQADGSTIPILEQAGVSPKSVSSKNPPSPGERSGSRTSASDPPFGKSLKSGRRGNERASRRVPEC